MQMIQTFAKKSEKGPKKASIFNLLIFFSKKHTTQHMQIKLKSMKRDWNFCRMKCSSATRFWPKNQFCVRWINILLDKIRNLFFTTLFLLKVGYLNHNMKKHTSKQCCGLLRKSEFQQKLPLGEYFLFMLQKSTQPFFTVHRKKK